MRYNGLDYSNKMSLDDIINLKKAQKKMTGMLKIFDKICMDNNICYWIFAGTLLGAIRHKGWIPYDGDIDVCVFEKDYNKLKKLLINLLPKKLWLQDKDTDPLYKSNLVKIRDLNSCYTSYPDHSWHNGLQIDIFLAKESNGKISYDGKEYVTNEILPTKRNIFENIYVSIPNNYDSCLKKEFNNYHQIPSVEKRFPHESIKYSVDKPCDWMIPLYPNLYKMNGGKRTKRKRNFKRRKRSYKKRKYKTKLYGGLNLDTLTIDNYVDRIFIINLKDKKERWKNITDNLKKHNISNYERFEACIIHESKIKPENYKNFWASKKNDIKYIKGALGCLESHYNIIKLSKKRNYKRVLILEDDAIFKNDYLNNFRNAIKQCVRNNINYDILQLSGNYWDLDKCYDNLYKINSSYTTIAYIVNSNIYNNILNNCKKTSLEIDGYYQHYIFSNKNSYCIKPTIITNYKDLSSITNEAINYTL